MVVRPWEVMYSIVDFRVWVSRTLSAKLEDRPVLLVLVVEKFDKFVGRVAVGFLWPYRAGT